MAVYYSSLANGDHFRMAFTIEENSYNGVTSLQLRAKEIKF
jgi:single-stranded-DNA-specific exonuclease